AVTREQHPDPGLLDGRKRLEALVGRHVEHSRHHLWAQLAGKRVPRAQLVSDEQHTMVFERERAMARCVARRGDYARAPRDVELLTVCERVGALDLRWLGTAGARHPAEETPERRTPHLAHRVDRAGVAGLGPRLAQLRFIVCVNQNARPSLPQCGGQSGVIGVRGGEYYGLDITGAESERIALAGP